MDRSRTHPMKERWELNGSSFPKEADRRRSAQGSVALFSFSKADGSSTVKKWTRKGEEGERKEPGLIGVTDRA